MPRRDDDDDDYDDRPRRPKKKRKPAAPSWPKWVAGGVAFAGCIAVAILVAKGLGNSSKSAGGGPVAAIAPGVVAEPVAGGANVVPVPAPVPAGKPEPAAGGVKYVPRESEKKFTEFLKANGQDRRVTEAEVFAIMGEPTRREAPVSGVKNGTAFTFYKAFWEVPGSGVSSQITFINGIAGGMIIGLEVGGKK